MIDKLFAVTDQDDLVFNTAEMSQLTDTQFVDLVNSKLQGARVESMKAAGDRRVKFVYFATVFGYYSFSHEKKTNTLIFSEQIRKGKKLDWKFVVGWKESNHDV